VRDEARERQRFARRLWWLQLLVLAACAIFVGAFFYHQILRREYYFRLSENNRLDRLVLRPARGQLRDRHQRLLATNRTAYEVWAEPNQLRPERAAPLLSRVVAGGRAALDRALRGENETRIGEDVSFASLAFLEARRLELPGIDVRERQIRYYTYGATAAHLLGYVGEVTAAQLERAQFRGARPGDLVGQLGLERSYDRLLRGTPGFMTVVVDHLGRQVDILERRPPLPGTDVELHIDLELQDAIEALLGEQAGAVVAIDPSSGAIRALASHPAFSPNRLVDGLGPEEWRQLGAEQGGLLFNRAIQSELPPGSVFKLVVAATALEDGVITPYTALHCGGGVGKGNYFFHCTKAHGSLSLRSALTYSCNSFFYQLGDRLGRERIVRGAMRLGFGRVTGIDLPFERPGSLPTKSWLERARRGRWYGGDNLSLAIGQGPVLVTPLQLASLIAMIANGGTLFRPQILQRVGTEAPVAPMILRGSTLQPHNLAALREGLWGAVNGGGTAWRAAVPEGVAGKTGSAQVVSREKQKELGRLEHSWFVGYAPYAAPRLALAVILENAGEGGKAAAPLAQAVFARFFELEARREPKPAATQSAAADIEVEPHRDGARESG